MRSLHITVTSRKSNKNLTYVSVSRFRRFVMGMGRDQKVFEWLEGVEKGQGGIDKA